MSLTTNPRQNGPEFPDAVPNQPPKLESSNGPGIWEIIVTSGAPTKDTMAPAGEARDGYLPPLSTVQQQQVSGQGVTQNAAEWGRLVNGEVALMQQKGATPDDVALYKQGFTDGLTGTINLQYFTDLVSSSDKTRAGLVTTTSPALTSDRWPRFDNLASDIHETTKNLSRYLELQGATPTYLLSSQAMSLASSLAVAQDAATGANSGANAQKAAELLGSDPEYQKLSESDQNRERDRMTESMSLGQIKVATDELVDALDAPGLRIQIIGNSAAAPPEKPAAPVPILDSGVPTDPLIDPNAPILPPEQVGPAIEHLVFARFAPDAGDEAATALGKKASDVVVGENGLIAAVNRLPDPDKTDVLTALETPDPVLDKYRTYARGVAAGALGSEALLSEAGPQAGDKIADLDIQRLGETAM